ncbi:MAG: CYTH domain-containing protein [Lachnospiraceae bacterium]|nr:CYTH domain-containing protein [Lachnospiraceae bacterium]
MEIERKYLVKTMPDLSRAQVKKIEQGYLCREPVVRIRKSNEDYILTYKSKAGLSQDIAIKNEEVELPLTKDAYGHLREKIDGALVEKNRYILPLSGGRKAELDVFCGRLLGLVFVEVEFKSEAEAADFVPPAWFGRDVSHNGMFTNVYLSEVESFDEWKKCFGGDFKLSW